MAKRSQLAKTSPEVLDALIRQQQAETDERITYLLREFVQCSFPYSDPGEEVMNWERKNGDLTFTVTRSSKKYPMPRGTLPRVFMFYVCDSVMASGECRVPLDQSLSAALRDYGYKQTTAAKGKTRDNFKEQIIAICKCIISFSYDPKSRNKGYNVPFARAYDLWWDEENDKQGTLFPSYIEISDDLRKAILAAPVPIPARVVRNHIKSPLEIDLAVTLNHRNHQLHKTGKATDFIPFNNLHLQFGNDYGRTDHFRAKLRRALASVKAKSWPELTYDFTYEGLTIHQSKQLVKPKEANNRFEKRATWSDRAIADQVKQSRQFDAETLQKAKAAAPRFDVYSLASDFWEWVDQGGIEVKTDARAMFVNYCKTHAKRNRA